MTSYQLLVNVLDRLRAEAPAEFKKYHATMPDIEAMNMARSRAFIHLYLKVRFGLLTFSEREQMLTEGAQDGGIDAFYIDTEHRVIHFVQSKFRTTETNFEAKRIDPEDLLMMDINRITEGENASESGVPYNDKIKSMIRRIRAIDDIGRYSYRVVILANVEGITRQKIAQLTGGFPAEIIDYSHCYKSLLFPLIAGTFFTSEKLSLSLNLSNKNAGTKISYTVATQFTKCEITVVFVPTLEIAKAMYKYRNSILQFNPRSYLGHEGKNVNAAIRSSIESRTTNEFALFNNGITVLSDESYLNERIGQKDRAQLMLVNPQIINGGQTAYTLSMIYRENLDGDYEGLFADKEVLVKIITFDTTNGLSPKQKLQLIEDISMATNQQSVVTSADRRSNDTHIKQFQDILFEKTGILMERKRGEFEDGITEGYVLDNDVVDRNIVFRVLFSLQQKFAMASSRKIATKFNVSLINPDSVESMGLYAFGICLLQRMIKKPRNSSLKMSRHLLTKMYFACKMWYVPTLTNADRPILVDKVMVALELHWDLFVKTQTSVQMPEFSDPDTRRQWHIVSSYFMSPDFPRDIEIYKASQSQNIGIVP